MNKREAIAALRELADKLNAMPIDGEALRISCDFNVHDVTDDEFNKLKTIIANGEPRCLGYGFWSYGDRVALYSTILHINLFGPKEVICP